MTDQIFPRIRKISDYVFMILYPNTRPIRVDFLPVFKEAQKRYPDGLDNGVFVHFHAFPKFKRMWGAYSFPENEYISMPKIAPFDGSMEFVSVSDRFTPSNVLLFPDAYVEQRLNGICEIKKHYV